MEPERKLSMRIYNEGVSRPTWQWDGLWSLSVYANFHARTILFPRAKDHEQVPVFLRRCTKNRWEHPFRSKKTAGRRGVAIHHCLDNHSYFLHTSCERDAACTSYRRTVRSARAALTERTPHVVLSVGWDFLIAAVKVIRTTSVINIIKGVIQIQSLSTRTTLPAINASPEPPVRPQALISKM